MTAGWSCCWRILAGEQRERAFPDLRQILCRLGHGGSLTLWLPATLAWEPRSF